jgi:hypothetical protein
MRVLAVFAVLACQTATPPNNDNPATMESGPLRRAVSRVPQDYEPCPPGAEPGDMSAEVGVGGASDGTTPFVPYTAHRCRPAVRLGH